MTTTWSHIVAHADMDAFYASVEQLDHPQWRGRPLIVGPKSLRGVVLTASYEARKFGVKSAMPMAEAKRLCADALVVPPRFERYQRQSEAIMRTFADFSPRVEAISLDEAFIDMTGAQGIFGSPERMARLIRTAVSEATGGLTASVGIASTKYVAKVASDFNKPAGITVVSPDQAIAWLDPLPVSRLWGVGRKTVSRLERLGLYTIGDVRNADAAFLQHNLGSMGLHFQALARAEDPRRVARRRVARSMGSDRTLLADVTQREDIEHHLRRSADRIGRRLRSKGYQADGVRVRLKTVDFKLHTRQAILPFATDSSAQLFAAARRLLDQFDQGHSYRLVGMAAYGLICADDPVQLDLFASGTRSLALERALDRVADQFGASSVVRAADLGRQRTIAATTPDLDFVEKLDQG